MDFDSVLMSVGSSMYTELADSHPKAVSIIEKEEFYIKPDFNCIKNEPESKIILFSAPGATGKSALAHYLSYIKHALLWDLSLETIASHSFTGMLVESLGPHMFSQFVAGLNNGQAVLVIDALDEAEMISGRVAVETLLSDLRSIVDHARSPNIILCARTETAHFIRDYYNRPETAIPISQYEISFFEEHNAIEFIKQRISITKTITSVTTKWIESQFGQIKLLLDNNKEAIHSFLGYAPVLEALAVYFREGSNDIHLLHQTASSGNSTDIFNEIMERILKREQSKVINGFREKCQKDYPNFDQWDIVYSIEEQVKRLANFLIFNSTDYNDFVLEDLPRELSAEYGEIIESFLKAHPFVRISEKNGAVCADFTGPAFRDYVLAKMMTMDDSDDYDMYAQEYFQEHSESSRVPSQLFFDFYHYFSPHEMKKSHFTYLYDAFKSKEKSDTISGVSIEQVDQGFDVIFSYYKGNHNDSTCFLMLPCDEPLTITQLNNAYIDISEDIVLGKNDEDIIVSNSTIKCKTLILKSHCVILSAYDDEKILISCESGINSSACPNVKFEIRIDIPEHLKISSPDIKSWFKLQSYAYVLEDDNNIDIIRFENAVKTILKHFRKHGKDAPGRHYEFIKNVIVGNSTLKNSILDFFLEKGIIFQDMKDPEQYKLDVEKLEQLGVNWGMLSQNSTPDMKKIFDIYKQWGK